MTYYRYEVVKKGFNQAMRRHGVILTFKNEIELTKSELTVSFQTLITRIGGILGVGRTLTWLINKVFDCVLFSYHKIRERVNYLQSGSYP